MDIIKKVKLLFPIKNKEVINEKINSFLLEYNLASKPSLTKESLVDFLDSIPTCDDFRFSLELENNETIILVDRNKVDTFLSDFQRLFKFFEESESIKFNLEINKGPKCNVRNIYHYESFLNFWSSKSATDILKILCNLFKENTSIFFQYLEEGKEPLHTACMGFDYNSKNNTHKSSIKYIRENCHFGNFSEYPFTPEYFYLMNRPQEDNAISIKLDILTSLFSIIAIYDITSINSNQLNYKLIGYKSFEGSLVVDETLIKSMNTYYAIYNWIYSSEGNTSDKIGLVRNILSIYLEEDTTKLDKHLFLSIKSAYKIYLKENIEKYLSIRSKIFDELSWVSQKSSEIVDDYFGNYQKSIFSFLYFFISVFILRVLNNGNISNVFSREATILSLAFLLLSICYLIFSAWHLNKERERLKRKYQNIKDRYKDLLIEKDIESILNNDHEFNYELSFLKTRFRSYTILWIITIFILIVAVLTVSEYLVFETLYKYVHDFFCPS